MFLKAFNNSSALNILATIISLMICTQSLAENVAPESNIITDKLSEAATASIERINNEQDETNEGIYPVETTNQSSPYLSRNSSRNSYSQLISLAFKGKGHNGVNSYADAAAQYCREARDANDANAQFVLGWMYVNGRGVEKDENVAALFFKKAADQGHKSAKTWLAESQGNPALAVAPSCLSSDTSTKLTLKDYAGLNVKVEEEEAEPFYSKGPIYQLVTKIAPRYHIDTNLAMAFIAVESGFNPKATSPKNAQGLMQLIPETAARFNVKNSYDPEDNIKGGLAYLQWLLTYFEGDVKLVAAAYNAGENAVDRYKGIPPYQETRKYVKKITSLYRKAYHPYNDNFGLGKRSSIIKISANY